MIGTKRLAIAATLICTAASAEDPRIQANYGVVGRYAVSWAYPSIKLDSAYIRGWTGKGVTVAVFDTGLNANSYKFAGNIAGRGYDVYAPGAAVTTDPNWHGTFVSSIIAAKRNLPSSGNTMYGVAYNAKILPIKIMDSRGYGTFTDQQLANGIDYATAGGAKVFNNSWNTSTTLTELGTQRNNIMAWYPKQIAAWERASAKGVVNVWAAGNDGKSDPGFFASLPSVNGRLSGSWIVVVAADTSGRIASWSNRCGISASYCITAPGQDILGVYQNGIATASGTSFAAPIVSGGVALLIEKWPYLTGAQITSILFNTANRKGIYADTRIYGNGYLDMDAATAPVGQVKIPTGSTIASGSVPLGAVSLPPGIGKISSAGLSDVMVLDEYDRAYGLPMRYLIADPTGNINLDAAYARFSGGQVVEMPALGSRMSFSMDGNDTVGGPTRTSIPGMGLPFLAMGDANKITITSEHASVWGSITQESDQPTQQGIMLNYRGWHAGAMSEQRSLWGMPNSDLGDAATTAFLAYQDSFDLGSGFSLLGGAGIGVTRTTAPRGLVSEVGDMVGTSANVGLSKQSFLTDSDVFGVGLNLPYHSVRGQAELSIPVSRDMDGNITYSRESIQLVGDSVEHDLQAWWSDSLSPGAKLNLSAALRMHPNGNSSLPNDAVGMASFSLAF